MDLVLNYEHRISLNVIKAEFNKTEKRYTAINLEGFFEPIFTIEIGTIITIFDKYGNYYGSLKVLNFHNMQQENQLIIFGEEI